MEISRVCEIFNSNIDILSLPIKVEKGNMVYKTLFDHWEKFLNLLNNTPEIQDCTPYAEKSIKYLKKSLEAYYGADYKTTRNYIKKTLDLLTNIKNGSRLIIDLDSLFIDSEPYQWFRSRFSDSNILYSDDLKHVPVNMRGKIKNYRYSVNGIPCLYLSNSIQTCWEEQGRPLIDSFWVCRYRPKVKIKILNLSITGFDVVYSDKCLKHVVDSKENYDAAIKEFFSNWVLQSACSVVVEEDNRVFKEEYVIPQLLMQIIKDYNVDGIMYFSTRVKCVYSNPTSWISKNIAIPAFDASEFKNGNNYYSPKIDSMFDISTPINTGLFSSGVIPLGPKTNHESQNLFRVHAPVYITAKPCEYKDTDFYRCEIELQNYFNNKNYNYIDD